MKIRQFVVAAGAAALIATSVPVTIAATTDPLGQAPIKEISPVTLKVTVTISRWEGDKKVASSPYILMVVPSYGKHAEAGQDGDSTTIQMGSETPVPSPTLTDGKLVSSYSYRTMGTNINVAARPLDEGRFNIVVGVSDSQVGSMQAANQSLPRFHNFRSNNRLTMRDGQTTQYAVATDTITGQVVKLDVTMNVVK